MYQVSAAAASSGAWVDQQIAQMRGQNNPSQSLMGGLNGGIPGLNAGIPGLGGGLPGIGGGGGCGCGGLGGFGGPQQQGTPNFGQNFGGPQNPFQQGFQQGQKAAKMKQLMGKLRRLMSQMGGANGMNPNQGMNPNGMNNGGAFASAGPGGAFASAGTRLV